jgi:hypothetical protein
MSLMVDVEVKHAPIALFIQAASDKEIPGKLIEHFPPSLFPQGPPCIYTVINIEHLQEQMRRAEAEWEEAREQAMTTERYIPRPVNTCDASKVT